MGFDNSYTLIRSFSQVISPGVRWLRPHTPGAGSLGQPPRQGTRSHMLQLRVPRATAKTHQSQRANTYFKTKRRNCHTVFQSGCATKKGKQKLCVSDFLTRASLRLSLLLCILLYFFQARASVLWPLMLQTHPFTAVSLIK